MNAGFLRASLAGACLFVVPLSAQEPPTWRLTRELRIDAGEQNLTLITLSTPPGGLAVAANGTIVVSQNQDGALRFFDARGASLGTFGRKGQGPGEFQTIGRLSWIADTLVVSDASTRRFTLISPDRKLIRTVPWPGTVSVPGKGGDAIRVRASIPRGSYADGSQLMTVSLATGSPVPEWPGGEKPGTPLIRVDSAGAFQRLIAWSPRRDCNMPYDAGAGMGSGNLGIPLCAHAIEDVAPDGSKVTLAFLDPGSAPAFRVMAFRSNGDTLYSRSYPFQSVSIPAEVKDSVRATLARGSQSRRDAAAKMPIPDSYPPVSRVLVGRDETTWLEVYSARGLRSWHVLDARGIVIGKIVAPSNTQFMAVSRDQVWAIETDNDGLQHIVRFRVTR